VDERKEIALIRQFIAGLKSTQINERLHLDQPRTYQDALDRALQLEGTYEVISLEAKRREQNGQGSAPMQQMPLGRAADPMDIGALERGKKTNFRGNYQRPFFQRGRSNYQFRGNRGSFSNKTRGVFNPRGKPQQSTRGGFQGLPRKPNYSPNWRPTRPFSKPPNDTCHSCGEKGHWEKNVQILTSPRPQELAT